MANYWAIAIGINQYQLFPPLNFAQADAEAIRDFLVTTAGFLPQNCLLMKNTGSGVVDQNFYPTKVSILSLLEELAAKSWEPEDHLWLFFSGYGINYQGKDYLMSAEANPDLVSETGIEVRSLMQSLQIAKLNVLLILDINRAFGTQADDPVGEEIIELAKELQMATILACLPEEFSHENKELSHGIFTSVFLSALNSGAGSSLTDLASYLSAVTPKICQEHWQPIQNPLVIIPSPAPAILPPASLDDHHSHLPYATIFPEESFAVAASSIPLGEIVAENSIVNRDRWLTIPRVGTSLSRTSLDLDKPQNRELVSESSTELISKSATDNYPVLANTEELNPSTSTSGRYIPSLTQTSKTSTDQTHILIWRQFIFWGGGSMVIVGLIATFFLCNHTLFRFKQVSLDANKNSNNQKAIADHFGSQTPTFLANSTNAGNHIGGLAGDSPLRKQALLELKKMSLRPNKANDLHKAIVAARKIQPGQPSYAQSQQNIQTWLQMILELAVDRVQRRQYSSAIAAAQVIRPDESLYPQAQAAIQQWRLESKQYVSNTTLLDAANALIQHGQASTYNRAIEVAKKVASGEPGFDLAQKSINRWSEKILDLAKKRAQKGELTAAIATATLVPAGTSAYDDAQDAMQKWQARKHN